MQLEKQANYTEYSITGDNIVIGNNTEQNFKRTKRTKRTPQSMGTSPGPSVLYLPYPSNIDIRFSPLSGSHIINQIWNRRQNRIRRRVHMPEQPQGQMGENFMLNGMLQGRPPRRDRQVRINFNMRRGQGLMFPMEEITPPPEPSLIRVEEPTVAAAPSNPLNNMLQLQPGPGNNPMFGQFDPRRLQRNFIDPLNPDFGSEVAVQKVAQTLMSRQYAPTRQCQYCPFDQCLDDQLRMDNLFPGLFDEPRTFLECRRYEKLFTVGNYDIVQEGLPDCTHPRFKRQLFQRGMQDDDIGCCST